METDKIYFLTSGKNAEEVKKNLDSLITTVEALPILLETGQNYFTVCGGDSSIQIEPIREDIKEIKFDGTADYKLTDFRYMDEGEHSVISFNYNTIRVLINLKNQEKYLKEKISQLEEKVEKVEES